MGCSPLLRRLLVGLVGLAAVFALPASLDAQVFVYPRRAGQTNVRYDDFDWLHINILAGPEADVETSDPGPRGGADPVGHHLPNADPSMQPAFPLDHPGVSSATGGRLAARGTAGETPSEQADRVEKLARQAGGAKLYFYKSERRIARRAVPTIEESYRDLMGSFDFAPPKTFPFLLYNSYQEFLQTNLFPIREGVLGVTSPRDLKLSLPYFGDHRRFRRVAHHELVHQFTIQKVRTVANRNDAFRDPLEAIPLWFIEGLAEYYTNGGMDEEAKMLVRDLAVHQAPERGYVMGEFFQRGPRSFLWIYKFGQVRCTFLEEVYGSGTLQAILEESYRLGQGQWNQSRLKSFQKLVQEVTGNKPKVVAGRFDSWLKDRAYESYLEADQRRGEFPQLDKIDRRVQGLDAASDGNILGYKTVDRLTGQNRIMLADRRDLDSATQIVVDGRPGISSLHPLKDSNFDVGDDEVAFIARWKGRDIIYRQDYSSHAKTRKRHDPNKPGTPAKKDFRVDIDTGSRTKYKLTEKGVWAAESPSIGPDGERIAFIGLDEQGQKDVYVLRPRGSGEFELTQITDDIFAERGLDWGEDGIVYNSYKTGHGRYNLFRVSPNPDADPERLTSAPTDHLDPVVMPDGTVMFVAYEDARANLHTVTETGTIRRTDVTTGLFSPAPGPDGGAWALFHYAGRRVPAQLTEQKLAEINEHPASPDVAARDFEERDLSAAEEYQPFRFRNWRVNNAFGILGITGSGIFGQLFASTSDRLRNHQLILEALAFGSFQRTDGALTYINQKNRIVWGASIFQDFKYRVDQTFPDLPPENPISFERFYGGRGLLRYPFNQYLYTQFSAAAGGTNYFLPSGTRSRFEEETPEGEQPLDERWQQINDSPRFHTQGEWSIGYDSIQYTRGTGPLSGSALLGSFTGDYQPFSDTAYGSLRLDGETYLPIYDRINAFLRFGTGNSFGDRLARQYFLSSFHTLRGVPFGNTDFLLGEKFLFSTLELQFPINFLVRIPFIDLEGIAGVDFGGVGDSYQNLWDRRVLNAALGVNFGLGPLVFRLHFAKPFDIGATVPNNGQWVPNLSLGWRYL